MELADYIRGKPVSGKFTYSKNLVDNYLKKTDKEAVVELYSCLCLRI